MRQHHREGADDRYRHRDQRDQRGAQLAEEQEHDECDEDDRLDQRADDLLDGRRDEDRGVEEHVIGEIARESASASVFMVSRTRRVTSTALDARRLIDADRRGRRAVEAAVAVLRTARRSPRARRP